MESQIVLTGSQVYGPATEKSDIDIVMHELDAQKLKAEVMMKRIIITQTGKGGGELENTCFYFNIGGLKINIICAKTELELMKWRHATRTLQNRAPIHNREERLREFKKGLK